MKLPPLPNIGLGISRIPAAVRWVCVFAVFLGLISFTSRRRFSKPNQEIQVVIAQGNGLKFVNEEETHSLVQGQVMAAIKEQGLGQAIQLGKIEKALEHNPFIYKANISQALNGTLTVEIEQSEPVARILGLFEGDTYITKQGRIIPTSSLYTSRVLLLEGPGARRMIAGMPAADTVSLQLFTLINRLQQDPFWHAQAAQLHISSDGQVDIWPQVGQQVFHIGPPTDIDAKFTRLNAFYKHILPHKGWAHYTSINVQYKHQIICQ